MFKTIKEFFIGKPKIEEKPTEIIVPNEVTVVPDPVIEEIKPDVVTISLSEEIAVSVNPPTVTHAEPRTWPFPSTPPAEIEVKKKRASNAKREEVVTEKIPVPAIKAPSKPRNKK
jgi:hypothetical protein